MQNVYLSFPNTGDLAGHSTTDEGKALKGIELLSFSHGVSQPLSMGGPSDKPRSPGRSVHQDFTVTKYVDQVSPMFNLYCSAGNVIPKAVISLFQSTGDKPNKFITYTLDNVIITSVSVGGGSGDLPVETLTLNYAKISWAFNLQDNKTGKGSADKTTSWDLFANKKG